MTEKKKVSKIGLEADYIFQPDGSKPERIGMRVEVFLREVKPHERWKKSYAELRQAVADYAPLSLWVIGPKSDDTYTLVVVRQSSVKLLKALQYNNSQPIDPSFYTSGSSSPLASSPLAAPGGTIDRVTVWIESPKGDRLPLPISAIGYAKTAKDAKIHFAKGILAVLSTHNSHYYNAFYMTDIEIFGPPGSEDDELCKSLRDSNVEVCQIIANWFGCNQVSQ